MTAAAQEVCAEHLKGSLWRNNRLADVAEIQEERAYRLTFYLRDPKTGFVTEAGGRVYPMGDNPHDAYAAASNDGTAWMSDGGSLVATATPKHPFPPVSTRAFPFDPHKPMSAATALQRVSEELSPEQSVALMLHYGSATNNMVHRVLNLIRRMETPAPDQSLVRLRTATHHIATAMAAHIQDLRCDFAPSTDPALIDRVNRMGKLVEGLQKAVAQSHPTDASNAIETFLDSEAGV